MKKTIKQTLTALLGAIALTAAMPALAQPVTLTGTNYFYNFDDLAVNSALPGEWVIYTLATSTSLGTINASFKGGPTNGWADFTGGFKDFSSVTNYGAPTNFLGTESVVIQNAVGNRSLGVRPISATDSGNAFVLKVANTTGFGKFKLDVDMLLLNAQPRSNNWTLDFGVSPDGSSAPTSFSVVSNNFFGTITNAGAFGSYHRTLDFGSLLDNQPGPIWIRIWNTASIGAGNRPTVGIDNYNLGFTNVPVVILPPTITAPPQSATTYVGDAFTFNVANGGTGPFMYQWYKDNFNNPVGTDSASLLIAPVSAGDGGNYYVIVSNSAGSATNNPSATLTVGTRTPIPTTIYNLRTNQDSVNWSPIDTTNFYTVTCVVISRTNMTAATSASFFIEDTNSLCGIDVFIGGDTVTRPAYGDVITVTGPLGQFNGLLEYNLNSANLTHIVQNLGPSGYNVPAKPFNFASAGIVALMETNYEGSLVVVSNVFIQYGGTGTNYPSGATINLTNQSGQIFTMFVDARTTDIAGQPIPAGLVNITGYISQFKSSAPFTNGYQLVPTYAGAIVAGTLIVSPIPLSAVFATGSATFNWTDASFVLQDSTNVAGPYTTISGASTGFSTNTTSAPTMFFRLYHQ